MRLTSGRVVTVGQVTDVQFFYNIIKNNPFGVYLVDSDFCLAEVSAGAQKVFENVRPLIGRDFHEVLRIVWPEPFASEALGRFRHTLETGAPYASPSTFEQRADVDAVEAYDWRLERVQLPDGRYGVVCYFYDLSERRRHEAQLEESEARFREVANAAPVLIWVADTENRGIWYNKAWLDFTGRSMDQELGDGWLENVHPEDLPKCAELCGGAFTQREPFRFDFRLRRHDGEWRIVDDTGVPRFADDGTFLGYIGCCVDVTDGRHAEAALRASEERYRRIFEQTSDLVLTADLDQVITDCNPAAAAAVGLSRAETIGRRISDFVSAEDFERTTAMLRQKMEQGGTTRYDVRVRNSAGEWLFWEINSGLTFDDSGKPVGLHVVGRDVTERKRIEKHQALLVGELNHRVKNTLAIVQALAHQTFGQHAAPADSMSRFEGRLQTLAAAHNLLTRQNWEAASLGEILAEVISPFCGAERWQAQGPELRLPPRTAVGLALAVHELATNAAKYGALSNSKGRIAVTWDVSDAGLELVWKELDGPAVTAPSRTGFGTRMIKRSLAAELGGDVSLEFAASGLICRVTAPVPPARRGQPLDDELRPPILQ